MAKKFSDEITWSRTRLDEMNYLDEADRQYDELYNPKKKAVV